ncbi:hypothetical protein PpBr36_05513 [Pyricularia pennisetigena]|uniref:hypothetical protein n=1 Tax=Pyricularia pennisetigena TaxID=1578925 RepID=UPI0011527A77|nr:hypothetical protein PpBr36_05513 [Pyricularia pennisetigena]TLS26458.1 hypothetical protein PpBr36_05513 [Pyricularia pennisetigena]
MYKSIFISAALALFQAHLASAKMCTVAIFNADCTVLKKRKDIEMQPSCTQLDFEWEYEDVTYKVRLHYKGCKAEIIGTPTLPDHLFLRGISPC